MNLEAFGGKLNKTEAHSTRLFYRSLHCELYVHLYFIGRRKSTFLSILKRDFTDNHKRDAPKDVWEQSAAHEFIDNNIESWKNRNNLQSDRETQRSSTNEEHVNGNG